MEHTPTPPKQDESPAQPTPAHPGFPTGSQLHMQDFAAADTRRKRKVIIGVSTFIVLVIVATLVSAFRKPSDPQPAATPEPAAAPAPVNTYTNPKATPPPPPPVLAPTTYKTGENLTFSLSYLAGAQTIHRCQVAVYADPDCQKNAAHNPPLYYLSGRGDSVSKRSLLLSLEKDTGRILTTACEPGFSVVRNGSKVDVCQAGNETGQILYYGFKFVERGQPYVGVFIMDNQLNHPYSNTALYKEQIKEIIPTIKL